MVESVVVARRQVEDHMLTMALGSAGSVGTLWLAVRFWIGTEMRDRVDVEARGVVLAAAVIADRRAFTEVDQVEDHAQVDVEALGARAGEDAGAVVDVVDGRADVRALAVAVGIRLGPDVVRRLEQVGADHRAVGLARRRPDALLDGVGVVDVLVRIARRGERAGVLQERVPVADVARELDAVDPVLERVAVRVDVELVADVGLEVREVGSAGGLLERDPVRDHHEARGRDRIAEEVDVGVVGDGVGRDSRRFPMARGESGRGQDEGREGETPGTHESQSGA